MASNFTYDADIDDAEYEEDIEQSDDYSIRSLNPISKIADTKAL
jgi:hypothetical protein